MLAVQADLLVSRRIFSLRAFILGLCAAIAISASFARVAEGGPPQHILDIIQKAKTGAEKEIIANQGQQAFDQFKKKLAEMYPLKKYPLHAKDNACAVFRYPKERTGAEVRFEIIDQAGAYYMTGIEATLNGVHDVAKWCFASAAALTPDCPVYLNNLAFMLNAEKNFEAACRLLEYARQLDPLDTSILANLAYSYYHVKRYDDAIKAQDAAFRLDPTNGQYQDALRTIVETKEREKPSSPPGQVTSTDKTSQIDNALALLDEKGHGQSSGSRKGDQTQGKTGLKTKLRAWEGEERFRAFGEALYAWADRQFAKYGIPHRFPRNACEAVDFDLKMAEMASEQFALTRPFWIRLSVDDAKRCAEETGNYSIVASIRDHWKKMIAYEQRMSEADQKKEGGSKDDLELYTSLYLGPVTIGSSDKGNLKLSVSAGVAGLELKYNVKTYNFGIKGSLGHAMVGVGSLKLLDIGAEVYFEVDLKEGLAAGVEMKAGAKPLPEMGRTAEFTVIRFSTENCIQGKCFSGFLVRP